MKILSFIGLLLVARTLCLPYLSPEDIKQLKSNFQEQLSGDNIQNIYYSAAGLSLLNEKLDAKLCEKAQAAAKSTKNLVDFYAAAGLGNLLGGCF